MKWLTKIPKGYLVSKVNFTAAEKSRNLRIFSKIVEAIIVPVLIGIINWLGKLDNFYNRYNLVVYWVVWSLYKLGRFYYNYNFKIFENCRIKTTTTNLSNSSNIPH